MSGLTDLIALCLVAFCAAVVGRRAWRWLSALRRGAAGTGCGGCNHCSPASKTVACGDGAEGSAQGTRR
jgi:hypothetical protein